MRGAKSEGDGGEESRGSEESLALLEEIRDAMQVIAARVESSQREADGE